MNKPKTLLWAGGTVVVIALGAWYFQRVLSNTPGPASSAVSSTPRVHTSAALMAPAPSVAAVPDAKSTVRPSMIHPRGAILTNGRPLEEVCIQYWAELYKFEITNEELARAQEAYLAVLRARRTLEDRLAQVERMEPSHFKVVIPAYPEEGQYLQQQFGSALASVLGADRAGQFLAKIRTPFDRDNFGWGTVDQVLDVTLWTERNVEVMEILHGFGLPASGVLGDITGVSKSTLTRDDLSIYTHLGRHFPRQSTPRTIR